MRPIISSLVALLGMTVAAHADFLSGVGFGGTNQAIVVCEVFNAGASPITVLHAELFDYNQDALGEVTTTNCGTLLPGKACNVSLSQGRAVPPPAITAHSCRIDIAESKLNVSGSLLFVGGSGAVLNSITLK